MARGLVLTFDTTTLTPLKRRERILEFSRYVPGNIKFESIKSYCPIKSGSFTSLGNLKALHRGTRKQLNKAYFSMNLIFPSVKIRQYLFNENCALASKFTIKTKDALINKKTC